MYRRRGAEVVPGEGASMERLNVGDSVQRCGGTWEPSGSVGLVVEVRRSAIGAVVRVDFGGETIYGRNVLEFLGRDLVCVRRAAA